MTECDDHWVSQADFQLEKGAIGFETLRGLERVLGIISGALSPLLIESVIAMYSTDPRFSNYLFAPVILRSVTWLCVISNNAIANCWGGGLRVLHSFSTFLARA